MSDEKDEEKREYGEEVGDIIPTTDGIGISIGGGFVIDPTDGSLGIKLPGIPFGIDLG